MANILLLGAGTQGLILVKMIRFCGHSVFLISREKGNYADASRYLTKVYYCMNGSEADYLEYVTVIIHKDHIDAVIPTGDDDAEFLCRHCSELPPKAKFKLPTYDSFQKGYDKNQLMHLCREQGYPHPQSCDLSIISIDSQKLRNFPYPAMLKPNCTTGGRGMVEIFSYAELKEKYPKLHDIYGEYHLQRFIQPGGKQIKAQLYVDESQRLIASSVMQKLRWYPNKAGSNCCAVSIIDDKTISLCHEVLKKIKWIGFADFDLIEDPNTGELLIMEINPRVPACIKFAFSSGINWAEIIINDYMGLPQKQYDYKEGVYLRHIGLDILWYLHADSKSKIRPSWFNFFGKNVYFQDCSDWTDPKPFLLGTLHNIKKLFSPSFKKAKGLS